MTSVSLSAQTGQTITEIQEAFRSGKLTVNEAISKQIDIIFKTDEHDHTSDPAKCGTPLFFMMNEFQASISEKNRTDVKKKTFLNPVNSAASFISPSGKFVIFYETTGNDAVPLLDDNSNSIPDYVEWVAEAADYSYDYEINTLGFTDFIPTGSQYRITTADGGAYGFAFPNASAPGGTEIGIENDFAGFPSNNDPEGNQKGAIKVTIAHELKHAIQFAQNGWNGDSDPWAEMDATLMEEVVYDEVNDYYNYLDGFGSNFFKSPSTTLIPGSYEDIAWALYFHERFGDSFWPETWDRIVDTPSISFFGAIEDELADYDVSFEEAVTEAMLWHFASGNLFSNPSFGFDESSNYPSPRIEETFSTLQTELTNQESISRFSGKYYNFDLINSDGKLVQIDFLPSSSNLQIGLIAYNLDGSIETRFITNPDEGVLNSSKTTLSWSQIDKLGIVFFNSASSGSLNYQFQVYDYFPTEATSVELAQNYPNPFNPNTIIPVTLPFSQKIKITVYDYLGREVQVLRDGVIGAGVDNVSFNAGGLASGVYFYTLESEEGIETKKMLLIK